MQNNPYYVNRFIGMNCASDLLNWNMFPNAKEITESYGTFANIISYFPELDRNDSKVRLVAVGDGHTPRTAALAACMTRWNCYSIDPELRHKTKWQEVKRLHLFHQKIEQVLLDFGDDPTIIACVHSHAHYKACLNSIKSTNRHMIALPCCDRTYYSTYKKPDFIFRDDKVWSQKNEFLIWKNV